MFSIIGCSKMEQNNLVGTRWETSGFTLLNDLFGYEYHVYEFIDKDSVNSYWLDRKGKIAKSDGECSYVIQEPYVIITHADDDIRKLELVDNITMVITTNTYIKYYKQP